MNRLCPSDEALSEYISGFLSDKERENIERHLIHCRPCRTLIIETYQIMSRRTLYDIRLSIIETVKRNIWVAGAISALILSFIFSGYFFQFLTLAIILGAKWILDSRITKTTITVDRSLKDTEKIHKETLKKEEKR